MAKRKPIPNNADGLWRMYHGSGQYHRYARAGAEAAYHHQVALCGKETRTGTGSFSVLEKWREEQGHYQPACGKCRRLAERVKP